MTEHSLEFTDFSQQKLDEIFGDTFSIQRKDIEQGKLDALLDSWDEIVK